MSAWVRDEILQVILQHRMQENLPTFFTSNFNFEELERHFAASRNGDETLAGQTGHGAREIFSQGNPSGRSQSPMNETIRLMKSHFFCSPF